MKKIVDARGLSCPQPVILTKKALEESDEVTTIVDNRIAVENVTKLATSKGFSVEVRKGRGISLSARVLAVASSAEREEVVVLITSNLFGQGEGVGQDFNEKFYALTR